MKFDTTYHHRPPVHFVNAGRSDASAPSKSQGHRGPRARASDLPRPANAPTGLAQRDRTSPSAADGALSKALNYPERSLDREAAVTLGLQRDEQQYELWRRSGFGFPQRCLDMARDNILAERNGHGRALVFLIPDGDAEANVGLLGHYLAKLGDGGRGRIDPALRDGIRACAELCAGYLVHTSWFEGAPIATYSHLANKLSKFPDRAACTEALAWIAKQVLLARHLHQLGDRQAAMLAGGLAKNTRSDACRDAILRITGWLLGDAAMRGRLNAIQVPMLLNALSKWPAHDEAKSFALQLADLMAPPSQLLYALDGQGVANSLNALSKWPGEARAEKPVLRMAKRLVAEPDLLLSMREQEVTSSLNALSKWVHREEAKQAMLLLAARLADEPQLRRSVQPQGVATALNALSKLSEAPQAKQAVLLLADRIATEPRLLQALEAQGVANALSALSKWPGEARALRAALLLTDRLATDPSLRRALKSQEFSGTLNALSKWPREDAMQHVALQLASRIPAEPELLPAMGAPEIANALNALCKWPGAEGAKRAALLLAGRLETEPQLCSQLGALELANSLGALAKWPDEAQMGRTAVQLAARLMAQPKLRQSLEAQGVATVLNALSKWPQQDTAKQVAMQLADRVAAEPGLLKAMDHQQLTNTLSALSRWPDEPWARHAARVLVAHLTAEPDGRWRALDARRTSNALFALSKWSDEHWATQFALQLAERIATEPTLLDDVDAQGVSDALSALSKWSGEDSARLATRELACRLIADTALQAAHGTQHLANTLNALAKWQREPEAMRAFWQLSTLLGRVSHPWRKFNIADMAQIGNAFARLVQDEGEEFERARSVLQRLGIHLELHPECFECSNAGHIGVLFKSLASLRMLRELRPLGTPALNRVMALCRETQLRDEPLETVGNLCLGLLPLARSPELARHRVPALKAFESMQPIMARKIDSYLRQGVQASAGSAALRAMDGQEACGTRGPALTFYQILKAYALVARQWKPRYIQGDRRAVQDRQAALKQWVDGTLARTRGVIEADLQEMSWNLIAQIEAGDNVLNALDLRIGKELTAITQRHPPTRFDLAGTHARMRTEPGKVRPVKAGVGATRHVTVDLQGRERRVDDSVEQPYSFYARLTGQPLVEVQLPGALSTFMLARTFQYQGEPWRFDLFGGSRLTRGHVRQVKSILANNPPVASVLPAMRYADSAPGSAFMALTHKLAPQREDWSRMQRALLEMVPRDHVVEGSLRVGWFEDVKVPGTPHPFRLKGPDGTRIALCPDDGCGFMKWEVAMLIPAVREHIEAWQAVRAKRATPAQQELVAEHEQGANAMPPQALMHYPRDEAVLAEAHEAIQHRLDKLRAQVQGPVANAPNAQAPALSPDAVDLLALYQMTIGGGYEGRRIRAVPSADDKLYLPTIPMDGFARPAGDLLVGKPPYDKENLLPIAAERVGTTAKGDATAHFLDQCFAIQYSYTGFDDDSGRAADMLHSKGMLIIPPPGYWSSAHDGMDLACSREDLKVLSRWKHGRDRAGLPDAMLSTGSLRVKDILMPGRLGALPIPELRKRNMDTDGDDAFVYAGYPKLAAHIRQVMEERGGRRKTDYAFKPPKTASPAFDEQGQYQAGRAREILAVQRGGQLVGSASNAVTRFLSQPDELREAMARDMMFGTYDGVDRRLRNGLRARISGSADTPALRDLLALAHEGIGRAHMPLAREVALLLHTLTTQLGTAGARPAPPVSAELAQRFGELAEAWAAATDTPARIHAILDHYPVCRLSHEQFPKGQPGYLEGEPELTIRNLFTLAVKVGTDALKSDTGTDLFSTLIEQCSIVERRYPDRVRRVPHTKQTAREFRDGRFDPKRAVAALERIPTLAAGVMEDAVGALQQAGLLASPLAPAERARAASPGDIKRTAVTLNEQAHAASARITSLLQANLRAWAGFGPDLGAGAVRLAGLEQAVKSTGSLEEKLGGLLAGKQLDLPEAVSQVNDALRYSIVLPPPAFASASRRIVAGLEEHGHVMTERTNHFNRRGGAFRALSVTLQDPSDGLLWEVQFHTEQTVKLKARYHDLYKQAQRARYQGASSDALRKLLQPAWKDFNAVPMPAGCDEIEDWQQEPAQAAPGLQPGLDGQGAQRTIAAYLLPLARRLGAQARRIEALVSPKVQTALRTCGGQLREDQSGDWRNVIFKKERSIARKIALRQRAAQLAPEAAAARVRDSLRYEVVLPAEDFGKTVHAILKMLGKQGLKVMRMKNPFAQPDTTYAGVNVNLRLAGGNLPGDFEIQFHTAKSLSTKLRGHKDYEKLRELPFASTHDGQDEASADFAAERERLLKKMRDAAALVERPQGIETLIPFDHYRDAPPSGTSRRTS
ncbi:XopAD/skwp family type III secretion system effector [Ralstonia solanacearum]|uniref:XopAD/skwp family type III secretion system effector n=1 Tax=Ralstonia solanacearum TaxID=305 RepID=UPI000F60BABA|nr:XopAD/skwp family type III secretion system effector [Ralstonia solanacearum]MCL9845682.1 Type III effector protein (Skwp5) [Ralstonia solanacearum]MDC6256241.1 XopAD/skwp family type III secretion system effector [Ralstonia solanacearum]MDC6260929.1 XopAD/skwp family type III secretion system effector [Ralstonia solanacearum]MDC6305546.1 XopAD/skwp family type III secretion system effector [Ralstonia solanacearum]